MPIYNLKLDQLVKDLIDVRRRLVDGDEEAVETLETIIVDVFRLRPVTTPPPDPALVDRLVTAARKVAWINPSGDWAIFEANNNDALFEMKQETLEKAERVYQFIRHYRRDNAGMIPSRREIANHMQTSTSVVTYYLALLVKDGRLVLTNRARDISIPGLARITTWKCRHCKFIGFDREPCPDHGDSLEVAEFIEL